MKSIRIEVDEKSYNHILFLLKSLKIKELRIIEEDNKKTKEELYQRRN